MGIGPCPGNYYVDGFYMPQSDCVATPGMDVVQVHQFYYEHDRGMANVPAIGTAYDPCDDVDHIAQQVASPSAPDSTPSPIVSLDAPAM